MIRVLILTILVQGLLLNSASARPLHGGVNGGGGTSVVCRDRSGKIQSAELLDLYEAKAFGWRLENVQTQLENYKLFMSRWIKFQGGIPAPESDEKISSYINDSLNGTWTGYTDKVLSSTEDYHLSFPIPSGCGVEQLAIFTDGDVRLTIQKEIWNVLNDQNKIALLAHEIFYRNYRLLNDVPTSDAVRVFVGMIFSESFPIK